MDELIWDDPPTLAGERRHVLGRHGWKMITGAVVVMIVILLGVGVVAVSHSDGDGLPACRILSGTDVEQAVGLALGPGRADIAESGGPPRATVCSFGRTPGPTVTVFAAGRAKRFYASQKRAALTNGSRPLDLSRADYQAFSFTRPGAEAFFLLKHGQYVNVLIYSASGGVVERLVAKAAHSIS